MMELSRQKIGPISFLTGGQGSAVLLLHGIPGSSLAWGRAAAHLADQYRVVVPDLLGFGRSDQPAGDYYMKAQAAALGELLEKLEISELYLAGHDFGGPVGLTLLDTVPELQIMGLVLTAANVFTDTFVPPPLRLARVPVLSTLVFSAMVGNRLGLRLLYWAAMKNRLAVTWPDFQQHLTPSGIDLTRKIFQRSLADLKGNYQAVENKLRRIDIPTLVLWGDKDPFFSVKVAARIHSEAHVAEMKIYPSTGHFVPEERPDAVARDMKAFFKKCQAA